MFTYLHIYVKRGIIIGITYSFLVQFYMLTLGVSHIIIGIIQSDLSFAI